MEKKTYIKKIIYIFIIMLSLTCLTCLVACSFLDGEKSINGVTADASEEVSLSWYINYSWFTSTWGDNMVSREITKKTGVNINFITPSGDNTKKLASMITADSLPDIITIGYWEGQVGEMIDGGLIYPLDELADKYDTYFWKVTDKQVVDWYTANDGHIYQYPNYAYTPNDYDSTKNIASNETFLVRKDIYEAIGSPDMTTPEGFVAAVEKADEMFGESEELIPVGAHEFTNVGCDSFDEYLFNFLAEPYVDESGYAYDKYTDESYIAWLKAFRKLGAKGLLKDDIFLDSRVQMEEKIAAGRYFCMLYQRTDMADQQKVLYNNNPESIYIAVDGPKNIHGEDYTLPGSGVNGWTVSLISKNCEYPDRAIKLFSYLISEEGQKMTALGVEGEMWDYDTSGKPVVKDNVKYLLNSNRTKYDQIYGADECYWMFQDKAKCSEWAEPQPDILRQMEEWTYPYTVYNDQYNVTLNSSSPEGIISNSIGALWGKTLPKLLVAPTEKEFDDILKDYITQREELGFKTMQDALTKRFQENIERLGIE